MGLADRVSEEPDGSVTLRLRLPDRAALEEIAKTMAMFGKG